MYDTKDNVEETVSNLSLFIAWIAFFGAIWAKFGLAEAFIAGASIRLLGELIYISRKKD